MRKLLFKVETRVGLHQKTTVNLWRANGELLHTRTLVGTTRLSAFLLVVSEYLVDNDILKDGQAKNIMISKSASIKKKSISVWLKE